MLTLPKLITPSRNSQTNGILRNIKQIEKKLKQDSTTSPKPMMYCQTKIEDPTMIKLAIGSYQTTMLKRFSKDFMKSMDLKTRIKRNSLHNTILIGKETIMKFLVFPKMQQAIKLKTPIEN
jgi:hypothetical protein